MFLELDDLDVDAIHPKLRPAIELYHAQQPVEAMELAFSALRSPVASPATGSLTAGDWILLGNLAQICGLSARCRAAYQMGHRAHPTHGKLAVLHAWELSARVKHVAFRKIMAAVKKAAPEQAGLYAALSCYHYSLIGWTKTALKYREQAFGFSQDDPLLLYVLSRAAGRRTDWEEAIDLGMKVVEARPKWNRARSALSDSLLCLGRVKEAQHVLSSAVQDRRHIWYDFSVSNLMEVKRQFDQSVEHQQRLIDYYPNRSRIVQYTARQLVLQHARSGQVDAARAITREFYLKGFEDWEESFTADRRKTYLPVPLVAQTTNHCVPTCAAMVAQAQGCEATPAELADQMGTRHGTPMWALVDTMRERGFLARCVKPEPDVIESMLEQGVPLIGELQSVFSGHVDVICGFDAGLQIFHLRDPMHWYGRSVSYKSVQRRYESSCSLWAMVAPENIDKVRIESHWINEAAEAYIDLSRAIAKGERVDAEEAYAKIPDEHPISYFRDGISKSVVLTETQWNERTQREVGSIQQEEGQELTLPQVRSMLSAMDDRNANEILSIAKQNQKKFGRNWVKFIESQVLLTQMKWIEAEKSLSSLAVQWPSNETIWSQLGQVKTQMGKAKEADRCYSIASEIAPDREYYQTQEIERKKHQIPFDRQLEQIREVKERHPRSSEIKVSEAILLFDGGDGLAYEKSLEEVIRFYPRSPWAYNRLVSWYLSQDRMDLGAKVMAAGRELMGEDEMPVSDFEKELNGIEGYPAISEVQQSDSSKEKSVDAVNDDSDSDSDETDSKKSLFARHYAMLRQKAGELEFDKFQALPELVAVKNTDPHCGMNWQQSAELLVLEIGNLLYSKFEDASARQDDLVTRLDLLLPSKVAGIGEQFAEHVVDSLNFAETGTRVIQRLLDWLKQIAPESSRYPNLEFNRAYLIEQMGQFNQSEEILNQLIRDHPCYVGAWYRLGQIYSQRSQRLRAWEMFEKCLTLQPGHWGSIQELTQLAPVVHPELEKKCVLRLAKLMPYSQQQLYRAANACANEGTFKDGLVFLEKCKNRLGESRHSTLAARFLTDHQQFDEALAMVDSAEIAKQDEQAAWWVKVDCFVQKDDFDEAAKWLDLLEQENPEDTSVIDQKTRLLRLKDPQQAKEYATEKFVEGPPLTILAYVALDGQARPLSAAKRMLNAAKPESKDAAALAIHQALKECASGDAIAKYLQYCHQELPHLTSLSTALVYHYGGTNQNKAAAAVAKSLHESDPENPEWLALLGWAVQDHDAVASIKYLKEAIKSTNSVDSMAQLARGYQLVGNDVLAQRTYEDVLKQNPNYSTALCNLMLRYKRSDEKISAMVMDTIEKRLVGPSDQYFLVQAVYLAKKRKIQLPVQWLSLAMERLERFNYEVPFRDEKTFLERAIYQWSRVRPNDGATTKISSLDKLLSYVWWPKTDWIPAD